MRIVKNYLPANQPLARESLPTKVANVLEISPETPFVVRCQSILLGILDQTINDNEFALIIGASGSGKTHMINQFIAENPGVFLFKSRLGMSIGGILTTLCKCFGLSIYGTNDQKMDRLLQSASGKAVIVDEADELVGGKNNSQVLQRIEILRQIQGAGAAVALVGLPELHQAILRGGETYVFRRIGYFFKMPTPTLPELIEYFQRAMMDYPPALKMAGPVAMRAQKSGLFGYLNKLIRRTRELNGDVDAAASILFAGEL